MMPQRTVCVVLTVALALVAVPTRAEVGSTPEPEDGQAASALQATTSRIAAEIPGRQRTGPVDSPHQGRGDAASLRRVVPPSAADATMGLGVALLFYGVGSFGYGAGLGSEFSNPGVDREVGLVVAEVNGSAFIALATVNLVRAARRDNQGLSMEIDRDLALRISKENRARAVFAAVFASTAATAVVVDINTFRHMFGERNRFTNAGDGMLVGSAVMAAISSSLFFREAAAWKRVAKGSASVVPKVVSAPRISPLFAPGGGGVTVCWNW